MRVQRPSSRLDCRRRLPDRLRVTIMHGLVAFVGRELFNAMLIRKELCSFASGQRFHEGLNHVESWLLRSGYETDGLNYITQSAQFLNTANKARRRAPCYTLSPMQPPYLGRSVRWAFVLQGSVGRRGCYVRDPGTPFRARRNG